MITIIVSTESEKLDLLKASKYIHDLKHIDSDIPMVNFVMHLYQAPQVIKVIDESIIKFN